MKKPVLLRGHTLTEDRALYPRSMGFKLVADGISTVTMTLTEDETGAQSGDWVRVYTPQGDADVYRVTDNSADYSKDGLRTVTLEHVLGALRDSVTGDKKSAKFEDAYLDELMAFLRQRGVKGITYMPSRNTDQQMDRLMGLCDKLGFTQISGEDINSSRQSFICKELAKPKFRHLVDAAWKLVNQEVREDTK